MRNKKIHIVSFAIPYPPNYGGVIDVFYKIKALKEAGYSIILHCFKYDERQPSEVLNQYCLEVNYYARQTHWKNAIGTTPYIMSSRHNKTLINRLIKDDYPIILEGLHTASIANEKSLKNRKIAIRMHNIEWDYYAHLATQENNWFKKLYFKIESLRLKQAQSILSKVDKVFTIAPKEQEELVKLYDNCTYLPAFHSNTLVSIKDGIGDYILYHGNLTVPENRAALDFIIYEIVVQQKLTEKLVIAGNGEERHIKKYKALNLPNVTFKLKPSAQEMKDLISNAQINLLVTFQNTGIKLKLLNALFNGRHVIVNPQMVEATGLEPICTIVSQTNRFKKEIEQLMDIEVGGTQKLTRKKYLNKKFSNAASAAIISEWLNPPLP